MNAFLQERITGMRIVQIFNAEKDELDKFNKINREYTQANLDSILYYAIFFPVARLSPRFLGLTVWWGARGVLDGVVTLEPYCFPHFTWICYLGPFECWQINSIHYRWVWWLQKGYSIFWTGMRK
ncbi:MAG: ABC transporter transmembrane domain-containing protein [Saprospiraceae bacterium]